VSRGDLEREVEIDGRFELSEDDREVVKMVPGSRLSIEERAPTHRRVLITGPSGIPIIEYWYESQPRELDSSGEPWLRDRILELAERAGLGASARAERILAEGGSEALLGAAEATANHPRRRVYTDLLLQQGDLTVEQTVRIVKLGSTLISDSKKAALAQRVIALEIENDDLTIQILDLIGSVTSGTRQSNLLQEVLAQRSLNGEPGRKLLELTSDVVSDSSKSKVLEAAITKLPSEHRVALVRSFGSVISASRRGSLYCAFVEADGFDAADAVLVAAESRDLVSSSAREKVTTALIDRAPASTDVNLAILRATGDMVSASAKERLLEHFIDKRTLDATCSQAVESVIDDLVSKSRREHLREALESARSRG